MDFRIFRRWLGAFVMAAAVYAAPVAAGDKAGMDVVNPGGRIMVIFDQDLHSRVVANLGKEIPIGRMMASECITASGREVREFRRTGFTVGDCRDSIGTGKEYRITGIAGTLQKAVRVVSYREFPDILFFDVCYTNLADSAITVTGWTNNQYAVDVLPGAGRTPALWSYQPGSYGWDNPWILPLDSGYARENYLGMTTEDYGGGTPVADIWRPDCGIAIGHIEPVPKFVSLPVSMPTKDGAVFALTRKEKTVLQPGASLPTFRSFVLVHRGDYFNGLVQYREVMGRVGLTFRDVPASAYGNEWCGWAYEADFTMEQIYNTLPKVKDLGLEWIVLDLGWYDGVGDFQLPKHRFPNGEADIRKFVDSVHAMGLKVQLWWFPLAVGLKTRLMANHPECLLLNEDGSPRFMPSFFKSFFLCPADSTVIAISREQVTRFIRWGFDGLKIDGNNQNCVPACYNPDHHHARPEQSLEALPAFYKMVYETALSIDPDAKMEICPCGTNQSFYLLPYMNETVAADPHGSYILRTKAKTLKALTGTKSVFYGDHVEHSDGKCDFASTVAVGGTIGSKFVYPPGSYMNKETGDVSLTPAKEAEWRRWITITNANQLFRGVYRGDLYDIGFDLPETHVVEREGVLYYGFFARSYAGKVEVRGLGPKEYRLIDYERNVELGRVRGPVATCPVTFTQHLLVKAEPVKK